MIKGTDESSFEFIIVTMIDPELASLNWTNPNVRSSLWEKQSYQELFNKCQQEFSK